MNEDQLKEMLEIHLYPSNACDSNNRKEKGGRNTVIMMSKIRYSGTTCSQRLRQYASEFLRAMSMIVAIEEREGRETLIMMSKRRSSGITCSH